VPGAAQALERRGDGKRRLDKDCLVEFADVDTQFQGTGRHDGLELAPFHPFFHFKPDFPRYGAVVGVGDDFLFALIDVAGDFFGDSAALGKNKCGAILQDYFLQFQGQVPPERFLVFFALGFLR